MFEHLVKPGARLWLLGGYDVELKDIAGFHASGLEYTALNHPVVLVSHEAIGELGACLVGISTPLCAILIGLKMTSRGVEGQPLRDTEITEHSAYREKDNGSLDEPLRLDTRDPGPKDYSYLDISKAFVVTLKMLRPLPEEPPMLDDRSFEVLQERTATLIEALDGKVRGEDMEEDFMIRNDRTSRSRQIATVGARGPQPRRGSLVKYGRSRNSSIQTLESMHQPCSNGLFLVLNERPSVFIGPTWAFPVRILSSNSAWLELRWLITG